MDRKAWRASGGRGSENGREETVYSPGRPAGNVLLSAPGSGLRFADVSEVQVKIEALELTPRDAAAEPEPRVPPPSQRHFPEPPNAPGGNRVPGKAPQGGSHPKTPIFSPFPSVKPLWKSTAARNLGLYGPTERTPTVHFPHMSRSFSKSGSGNSSTKKR